MKIRSKPSEWLNKDKSVREWKDTVALLTQNTFPDPSPLWDFTIGWDLLKS